ncbi:hypothetical protein IMCC14465_11180 [alpha proteobacterium IMCC14465]|uniref:Prepilin-type N-terminal cleavage/methylation domain-containing protein n=1 Tax=alpha proteobacterium IMCC14465 TaxID=1220535 RepID=J9DWB5_9PROT|nr:hypothetical protein IMCC14465_11180 [alpha proteobacterium IMCC14465]
MPFANPKTDLKINEAGFSVVEVAVALTLMAIAVVGAMSLLGASTTEFYKSQSRSKVEMVANGLLEELTLRHANGDTIASLTIDDWSSYLTSNDLSTTNATLNIANKTGLSDYTISATSLTDNYLIVSGSSGTPEAGDVFLIEDNVVTCRVASYEVTALGKQVGFGDSCDITGLTAVGKNLLFADYKATVNVTARGAGTVSKSRQFFSSWQTD